MKLRMIPTGMVFVLVAALLSGCDRSGVTRSNVTGKVMYNGQALTIGTVLFYPEGGGEPERAIIGRDGTYHLSEALPGNYHVAVITPAKPANGKKAIFRPSAPDPVFIPEKFSKPASSNLQIEIGKKEMNYDITMTN